MVIGMNRGHKQLILEDGSRVPYDYLVMCAGQQFQVIFYLLYTMKIMSPKLKRFKNLC